MQPVIFPREKGSLLSDPDTWWLQIMVRLKPNISDDKALAALAVSLNQAVRSTVVIPSDRTVPPLLLLPGARGWNYAEQELAHPMPLLLAIAGLVLLLACVNVANLLLARFSSRQHEISVRMAIGAGRMRVARQMFTESLCLSTLGGSAGLLIGYLGRNLLPRLFSTSWGPLALSTRFDWQVFAFTLAISVLTGIGFGVGPAWQAAGASANSGLKDGATTNTRRRRGLAGKALVIVQVSLCMLLLVSAGLFVRTLANLNTINAGFNKKGILLFALEPPARRYPAPKNVEILHRIEDRIASLPGVESATLSREVLLGQSGSDSEFIPDGQAKAFERDRYIHYNSVGQDFFTTMGIPILFGRSFGARDTSGSPGVAIISRALAQRDFAGRNPVGSSFRMEAGGELFEIVGVCADAKYAWIREIAPPVFYVLYTQQQLARGSMTYEVRTEGNPLGFVEAIRKTVESVDKDLPLIEVRTQQQQIDAALAPERKLCCGDKRLWHPGGPARLHRSLWCDCRWGVAPRQRDWRPHGARRSVGTGASNGDGRSTGIGVCRHRCRTLCSAFPDPVPEFQAFWSQANRPHHARRSGVLVVSRCDVGGLGSVAQSVSDSAGAGFAARVEPIEGPRQTTLRHHREGAATCEAFPCHSRGDRCARGYRKLSGPRRLSLRGTCSTSLSGSGLI
jgi:predicted permease